MVDLTIHHLFVKALFILVKRNHFSIMDLIYFVSRTIIFLWLFINTIPGESDIYPSKKAPLRVDVPKDHPL